MKYLVDIDELERQGVLKPEVAARLREEAGDGVVSGAIHVVLGFGAVAVAAGLVALFPSAWLAAAIGAAFVAAAFAVTRSAPRAANRLADVWMVAGALTLAVSAGALIDRPFWSALAAAVILLGVAVLARSRLLMAVAPLALAAAIGASAGYWEACYTIAVREPTLTIALFSALGFAAWTAARRLTGQASELALTFARMSVVLVNLGFWVGSLWGDAPGNLWRHADADPGPYDAAIPAVVYAAAWAAVAVAAGWWGARNGRRFMVNAAATFGAINFYTQWFVRLGATPLTVLAGGIVAIAVGSALLRYNGRTDDPPRAASPGA